MARSDRLFRLLQTMRTLPKPVTAARLAEETGVSVRSLYRDIDSLRAAGARIDGERGYGYRLTEDYALPPQTLDRLEIEALALGMAEVRAMGDPDLAAAAASVAAKGAATLPDDREQHLFHCVSKVYRPEARYAASHDLGLIRQACWREEALTIHYTPGVPTARLPRSFGERGCVPGSTIRRLTASTPSPSRSGQSADHPKRPVR